MDGVATQLWMLFAARAFAGACAGNIAAAQAYIADVTRPEKRAKGMGMIGAAFGLGFIIGPALGGLLAGDDRATADVEMPAWVAAGLSLLGIVRRRTILPESLRAEGRRLRPAGPSRFGSRGAAPPELGRLILIFFLVISPCRHGEHVFALWATEQFAWGPRQVGYVFAYVGVLSAIMQGGLIGLLTRRFGEERLLLCGLALIAAGLLVLPLAATWRCCWPEVSALALGMGACSRRSIV